MTSYTQPFVVNPMSYPEYRQLTEQLVAENKTTGPEQSDEKIAYTKLNLQRSKRVEKQFTLNPELAIELALLNQKLNWLVLSESWCGDGAQLLPAIAKITEHAPEISLTILLRDENPTLMQQHLTNGSQAIPKLICTDAVSNEVLFTWGPRPAVIQQKVAVFKSQNPNAGKEDLHQQLAVWYVQDKSQALQYDLLDLLKMARFKETFKVKELLAS